MARDSINMIRYLLLGMFATQVIGILGFIVSSSLLPSIWANLFVVVFFTLGNVYFIFSYFPEYSLYKVAYFSFSSALSFVLTYQLIGFHYFTGLVKDVDFFSGQHFSISCIVFSIMFLFYSACCLVLLFKTKST